MYKIHVKWTKLSLDTACLFTTGLLRFSKSPAKVGLTFTSHPIGQYLVLFNLPRKI